MNREATVSDSKARAMWYEGMGWYFKGPEDPGFCVLRFTTKRYSLLLDEKEGNVRGIM